jgi:type IV pilus assembly protein PilM
MGLFGRKSMTVGLDIGSGLIKLVAISHASGGPVLTKVALAPIGHDAIVEGEIMDPGIVAEAIKGLLSSAGIKTKTVVTAVGGRDVIVKKITMDRMQEAEAREVIRWEAEQHVPFDMDNVELDFQILDPEGEGLQMTVLLVAAKRELVDHKLSLLADVGLQPSIIDVDAFALHNAFDISFATTLRNGARSDFYRYPVGVPVRAADPHEKSRRHVRRKVSRGNRQVLISILRGRRCRNVLRERWVGS